MTDRELMQQALDALEKIAAYRPLTFAECSDAEAVMGIAENAIPTLRERLAQPEQEPVAWRWRDVDGLETIQSVKPYHEAEPLYTAPQQRKPLTDEEISNIWDGHVVPVFGKNGINPIVFARAIEAAHGIKGEA